MFKYIDFQKVETEITVLEFKSRNDTVKVNHFNVDVVSIESDDEIAMDELIQSQPAEIECVEISKDEFKNLISNSSQLNRIRDVVKSKIASVYDVADEIAMSKKDVSDTKRIKYEHYVKECLIFGDALKTEIGY